MNGTGRRAVLPTAGYRLPQRLFADEDQCRVRFFPERGGEPVDIDLTVLPVARELRDWMALGVLGVTGPAGTRRTTTSALDTVNILKRFCRYLVSLSNPPTAPAQLCAIHLDGFMLTGTKTLHRDMSALRTILRFAPGPPAEFAARLAPQVRLEVDADIALVARRTATAQTFPPRQPGIEPLPNGGLGVERLTRLEPTTGLVVVRQRGLLLDAVLQQIADLRPAPGVVLLGNRHEGPDLAQLLLGLGGGLEATTTKAPSAAVLGGVQLLEHPEGPVPSPTGASGATPRGPYRSRGQCTGTVA
ncbi:hypothetical protein [Streptomyces sp. NPDC087294]|uniref:hypothetical protein n=1 Tax=Streptomyces sp. NPDC087294 TaxID=3365777 RepID=UPI003813CED7